MLGWVKARNLLFFTLLLLLSTLATPCFGQIFAAVKSFDPSGIFSSLFGLASGSALVTYFLKRLINSYDRRFTEWEFRIEGLLEKFEVSNARWDEKYETMMEKLETAQREFYDATYELRKDIQRVELETIRKHECEFIRKAVQDITELRVRAEEAQKDLDEVKRSS